MFFKHSDSTTLAIQVPISQWIYLPLLGILWMDTPIVGLREQFSLLLLPPEKSKWKGEKPQLLYSIRNVGHKGMVRLHIRLLQKVPAVLDGLFLERLQRKGR